MIVPLSSSKLSAATVSPTMSRLSRRLVAKAGDPLKPELIQLSELCTSAATAARFTIQASASSGNSLFTSAQMPLSPSSVACAWRGATVAAIGTSSSIPQNVATMRRGAGRFSSIQSFRITRPYRRVVEIVARLPFSDRDACSCEHHIHHREACPVLGGAIRIGLHSEHHAHGIGLNLRHIRHGGTHVLHR